MIQIPDNRAVFTEFYQIHLGNPDRVALKLCETVLIGPEFVAGISMQLKVA